MRGDVMRILRPAASGLARVPGALARGSSALLRLAGDVRSLEPARVEGVSMAPTLSPGDRIAVRRVRSGEPRVGHVVLARHGSREVVKRVVAVDEDLVTLAGDNRRSSTDPGAVARESIAAIVVARYWPLIG